MLVVVVAMVVVVVVGGGGGGDGGGGWWRLVLAVLAVVVVVQGVRTNRRRHVNYDRSKLCLRDARWIFCRPCRLSLYSG